MRLNNMKIPDISESSYIKRTFPIMYAQEDFTYRGYFYLKNDEISVYHHNYLTLVKWMKENKINTNTVLFVKNTPCL